MAEISTDGQIQAIFEFYRRSTRLEFPRAGRLNELLNSKATKARASSSDSFAADREMVQLFASAAIEMWHRAIHSFIVSAALTPTSSIWSSVAGYYASHYVIRAYAHLLGRYMLYRHKKVVVLGMKKGTYYCHLEGKHASDREHKAYWRFVRDSGAFKGNPLLDVEVDALPRSDGAHRNKANYFDHIGGFASFSALTKPATVERIERISDIEVLALPIPNADRYPDLDSVQIIAYHRIVGFRSYLDGLLSNKNRFWNSHRTPSWCLGVVDFQIVAPQIPVPASQP